ncbi:YwpF-like family protein [Mesobacillus harenae]|uniref:YwpF-like family protein n=1 Tax=Mesobacillus harenae TaxID=2213203 RepID=UPI001580373E|nr:YwpF-like family protein [Mesobacillus harenae]
MKTFRLISLQVVDDENITDIEMKDGLIINKEDEKNTWLLEAFVKNDHVHYFEDACKEDKDIVAKVVITKKDNDPASFKTKVCSVIKLEEHASVMLKGTLHKTRNDYAEILLEHLIDKGLSGQELLNEFKTNMLVKPRLVLPKRPS